MATTLPPRPLPLSSAPPSHPPRPLPPLVHPSPAVSPSSSLSRLSSVRPLHPCSLMHPPSTPRSPSALCLISPSAWRLSHLATSPSALPSRLHPRLLTPFTPFTHIALSPPHPRPLSPSPSFAHSPLPFCPCPFALTLVLILVLALSPSRPWSTPGPPHRPSCLPCPLPRCRPFALPFALNDWSKRPKGS
ncbi:unnamed protein product [Cyclocybe aegerita]|uniref:Uncharacterized protein n=1 Tax=Cyclocybe aegerita TaxID=1973307 RepID=A0A8S0X3H8_CYCAE|nr:unnamed protein product [Cyclocybe aegerita]